MKSAIELFSALGRRLADFGGDAPTQEVAERACRANGWFTPADVRRAVAAIADDMLRRDRLETWLAPYPVPVAVPRRVLVVMAGNIPLVGFFDLLCVLAAGHRCLVKPSAKDRVLTEYVVGMLREIDPEVPVEFYDGSSPVDAVIATGSATPTAISGRSTPESPPCCAAAASRSPCCRAARPKRSWRALPTIFGPIQGLGAAACRCFSFRRGTTCGCGCLR